MVTKAKKLAIAVRENKGRDLSPKWDGHETWSSDEFSKHFRRSMEWYRLEKSGKELKPKVIDWMGRNGYTKDQISDFKKTKDNRCGLTMGAVAANLLKGMPELRTDFNDGRNTETWLRNAIQNVTNEGKFDSNEEEETVETLVVPQISIQERVREASYRMTEEIEDAIESFSQNSAAFDPKAFKVLNLLKGKDAKPAHARIIKDCYQRQYDEYVELQEGKCEQLKEAYRHLSKADIKKIVSFYQEILSACDMLMQEAKVNRKPRAKKTVSKDKLVAKLKFAKTFEPLKLVSINPTDIIGAKELWIYNTKSRKLGKYVANEYMELGIKGTSITGFNENYSIQKTLRKPEDKLKEFKSAGKVVLRKFLEDINAVDTKMNGRINEETVLLKVF